MWEEGAHPPARKLARQLHHLAHPLPRADMPLRPGPFRHQLLHLGVAEIGLSYGENTGHPSVARTLEVAEGWSASIRDYTSHTARTVDMATLASCIITRLATSFEGAHAQRPRSPGAPVSLQRGV